MQDDDDIDGILWRHALRLLTRRDYTVRLFEAACHNYITKFCNNRFSVDACQRLVLAIPDLLQRLQNIGYLSDRRYVCQYIASYINKYSMRKIYDRLCRVVDAKLVCQVIADEYSDYDQRMAIERIWQKKFHGQYATRYSKEYMRQLRYLQMRGFAIGDIHALLSAQGKD
jgi:SOS response regulatory protein OraA/RecX